ncbi:MAG: hypothetical protein OHK93_004037 [Ramalina farinacea]|uniref:Methyltransferase domain-containing protein n=1 Tax=Ramalina farinacea TaxID=258253 RepID=A0AA43QG04_9LECA|nr:hypothetical protein [Ramalina farinacea]
MRPLQSLPINPSFQDSQEFVESLLNFVTSSELFQTLCGGIHLLDFLTVKPNYYCTILPLEWREWFDLHDVDALLDFFLREDQNVLEDLRNSILNDEDSILPDVQRSSWRGLPAPPASLLDYILAIRKHSLNRGFAASDSRSVSSTIPRQVAVGMKPKKIHEVWNFSRYIEQLTDSLAESTDHQISHIIDYGSGQNYLGRTLASPPYCKSVIALESRQHNIDGAKTMDVTAKLVEKEMRMRNKKQYRSGIEQTCLPSEPKSSSMRASGIVGEASGQLRIGNVQYIETMIENGDLSEVTQTMRSRCLPSSQADLSFLVVSLHSCGNLMHHGIRSLVQNASVKAVAMVGCCYNLVTERLGPPTSKLTTLRPPNERLEKTGNEHDPQGFPMSERLATYEHQGGRGLRLNITARMMACQAPQNWTPGECESFFTRHYYRALLQRIFMDRGLVDRPHQAQPRGQTSGQPHDCTGTYKAITIGSLRKACYQSFAAYVRGAVKKLTEELNEGHRFAEAMEELTDKDIESYESRYSDKKKQLCIIWSLMAFSATVVESTMVVDRWLYLKEQQEVNDCWVETVFDYGQSPRNLVIVGIKR